MNRPKKDYYTKYWVIENGQYVLRGLGRYQEDLEKYCDFIEWKLEETNEALNDHIKALDKACELIAKHFWGKGEKKWGADEWKEWLMKDEKTKKKKLHKKVWL